MILSAPLKQTPQAMVRVYEDWIDIKDTSNNLQGNLRVLMFLEDNGIAANQSQSNIGGATQNLQEARDSQRRANNSYNSNPGYNPQLSNANAQNPADYQQVW